ncbi:hypothetical protein BC567DRAFT_208359 [Phyllosticta citribraziliensis]
MGNLMTTPRTSRTRGCIDSRITRRESRSLLQTDLFNTLHLEDEVQWEVAHPDEHRVVSVAAPQDTFGDWVPFIIKKWRKQSDDVAGRVSQLEAQNDRCVCGRPLKIPNSPKADIEGAFRATQLKEAPVAFLCCDACYTYWYLHGAPDATVEDLEQWKEARATFAASKVEPVEMECICSTWEETVRGEVYNPAYQGLVGKLCKNCYCVANSVVERYDLDMQQEERRKFAFVLSSDGKVPSRCSSTGFPMRRLCRSCPTDIIILRLNRNLHVLSLGCSL